MTDLSFDIGSNFSRYYQVIADKIQELVAPLSDDQLWSRPYPYGNSIGHLLLHLTGNLNYYIGTQLAGTGYVRNRDLEFSQSGRKAKDAVLKDLLDALVMVQATLARQAAADWPASYTAKGLEDAGNRFTVFLRCAAHADHHLGQMIYLRKEIERQASYGQRA